MEDRKLNILSKANNTVMLDKPTQSFSTRLSGRVSGRALLDIDSLTVVFNKNGRRGVVLDDISVKIPRGKIVGLVGESGCGKTVLGSSVIGLLPERGAEVVCGEINFYSGEAGRETPENLLNLNYHGMKKYRGSKISMIFQEPMSSLNPVYTAGSQIAETIKNKNYNLSKSEITARAFEILAKAGMPDPARVYDMYPHQLSGGMRQRVVIAIALANNPGLIIADEPTTALDITVSEQILFLLCNIRKKFDSSIILITHDLSVVANVCDEVYVMYRGTIVESGPAREIFTSPKNPYTIGLMESLPESGARGKPLRVIGGSVPSIFTEIKGCKFKDRCYKARVECFETPPVKNAGGGHYYRCHF